MFWPINTLLVLSDTTIPPRKGERERNHPRRLDTETNTPTQSSAKGYRFGWIWNTVHEQPSETFRDFWKQRRRWYTGILSIPSVLVQVSLVVGVIGEFVYWVGYVLSLPLSLSFVVYCRGGGEKKKRGT